MNPLGYSDLYTLCEELQQLVNASLQAVSNTSPNRYILVLNNFRQLVIDLTPNRPFIVSISSTKLPRPFKKTPILNFLEAHFTGKKISAIAVAQKPNRTVRIEFGEEHHLQFKCFPHGQHLLLLSGGKVVNFPLRPKEEEDVSFVSPECVFQWDFNQKIAQDFNLGLTQHLEAKAPPEIHLKILKKLQKALAGIEEGSKNQEAKDLEKINLLEKMGVEAKDSSNGEEVERIYEEIKRLRRKASVTDRRRLEIIQQIEKIKTEPASFLPHKLNLPKKSKLENFSGTRVKLSEHWELWVGRTAWQNDDLLKAGSSHELWLHLRDYPGAHGLIRGPKKTEPTFGQIETAARIVAILSQSKKKPFLDGEKLDFIVTPKKFVKKRKGDAPGRVIVERETVRRIAFKAIKFEVIT